MLICELIARQGEVDTAVGIQRRYVRRSLLSTPLMKSGLLPYHASTSR
jgi:hypothetical protein